MIDSSEVENAMQDAITTAIDELEAIAEAENFDDALLTQVGALCCLTCVWDGRITVAGRVNTIKRKEKIMSSFL